jgi:hypothetical protein
MYSIVNVQYFKQILDFYAPSFNPIRMKIIKNRDKRNIIAITL